MDNRNIFFFKPEKTPEIQTFTYTLLAKSLIRSEFQYFAIQQKSEKNQTLKKPKTYILYNNNTENLLKNSQKKIIDP